MSAQPQLFYEDIFDVARAAVQAIGGAKKVAAALWPHAPIAEAQRKLLDCLNRERPEKLELEEFMAIMRMAGAAGFHQAKHWFDHETGYRDSEPMDPVVERDRLAEELARAADNFTRLQRTAERLLEPNLRIAK